MGRIEKPENMPVDADGNRAHIISGPDSIPGRMNLGRLYIPYFGAAARDIRKQMLEEMGLDRNFSGQMTVEEMQSLPLAGLQKAIGTMLLLYKIVSPRQYKEYTECLTDEEQWIWLTDIVNTHLYLYIPIETQKSFDKIVLEIEKNFKLVYGPVSYVGRSGRRIMTKNSVRIAPIPIMLLDKIADTWLSADIGKHNNFGITAAMNRADKYSRPWRYTPPRLMGESENRVYVMYGGRKMMAEMMDRSHSIVSQKHIAYRLTHSKNPLNIEKIIDRDKIPFDGVRSVQILQHVFRCCGFQVVYEPEE